MLEPEDIRQTINFILITNSVEENSEMLFKFIPELRYMVGFEHKHPHHHLDVWGHTNLVLDNLKDTSDLEIKMAGLLHDIGKPFSYQDEEVRHFHGHPKVSEDMCVAILKRLGYPQDFINNVRYLVLYHDTPIDPYNLNTSHKMTKKLLKLQYADARAHHPDKVKKRTDFLDEISTQLEELYNIHSR